jgi:hypothetical protein
MGSDNQIKIQVFFRVATRRLAIYAVRLTTYRSDDRVPSSITNSDFRFTGEIYLVCSVLGTIPRFCELRQVSAANVYAVSHLRTATSFTAGTQLHDSLRTKNLGVLELEFLENFYVIDR